MSAQSFRHPHRVTYGECTVGNHVYYARYFDLLEETRGEFFRHLGRTFQQWQDQGVIFPIIEVQARYLAAARYDDLLTVDLQVAAAKGIRLTFDYRLFVRDEQTVVEARTCHVCAGLNDRPRRLPEELLNSLAPYLATPVATPGS